MFQFLCFALIPVIAMAAYGRDRGARSPVFAAARYVALALAVAQITAVIMIPLGRAAVRIAWNGMGGAFLYVDYGTVAAAFACAVSLALGLLLRFLRDKRGATAQIADEKRGPGVSWRGVLSHVLVLLLLWLTMTYIWGLSRYGNVSFEEIVFHLNVPLEGTSEDIVGNYLINAGLPMLLWFLFFEALAHFPARRAYRIVSGGGRVLLQVFPLRVPFGTAMAGLALWLAFLLAGANGSFGVVNYVVSQMRQSELIEREYVDPRSVAITFPGEKRNLITIYVESAETSSQDRVNGGFFDVNYIPEMTRIAKENVSFSQSGLIEGAAVAPGGGWTIAGLVAQTAGLPLKLYTEQAGWDGVDNQMNRFSSFMPGATTLGDILKEAGYRNVFMCGSDLTFGGRRNFFTQHGGYEARDLLAAKAEGRIPRKYYANWGFEDEKLYEWAREELTALSQAGEPFHFSMLTADTHNPDGYLCRLCGDEYDEKFANVLACSSRQLDAFLVWCKEQPFYENTTIVVTGDHASMTAGFYEEEKIDTHSGNRHRKVYNAFINSAVAPAQEENRQFTTLDFFPTVLAALGAEIEGERLGLGTNLFSGRETLAEEYGYDALFEELSLKSIFYNETFMF